MRDALFTHLVCNIIKNQALKYKYEKSKIRIEMPAEENRSI